MLPRWACLLVVIGSGCQAEIGPPGYAASESGSDTGMSDSTSSTTGAGGGAAAGGSTSGNAGGEFERRDQWWRHELGPL
jgi:hypothetical protein